MRSQDSEIAVEACSLEVVERVAETGRATQVVWLNEGQFNGEQFAFNQEHSGFEPMLLLPQYASHVATGLKRFGNERKEMMRCFIEKDRETFVRFYQECVNKGARHAAC